jgi:ATP-binding cassette subfamily B protein
MKLKTISDVMSDLSKNTRRMLKLAWGVDSQITFLYYFTAAIGALIPLGASYVIKLLIDELQYLQTANIRSIPFIIVFILASRYIISLIENILYWGYNQTYLDYLFRYKLQNKVTLEFHKNNAQLDIGHLENHETQDLITKTRDTMQWRLPDFLRVFSYLFRDIVGYFAAFFVVFSFQWWIPLLITIITLPRLYLKAKYGSIQWSIWGSGAPQVRKLWYFNWLLQEQTAIKETRVSQSSSYLISKFKKIQEKLYNLNKKPLDDYLKVSIIPPFFEVLIIILVSAQFLPTVITGAMTIGSFTLFINMLEQLSGRAANASAKLGELYENSLYVNHFFDLMNLPKIVKQPKNPVILDEIKPPKIEFKNVSFQYPDGPKVLNDVSFIIDPGESVAFVGHNGAGKTTIIKLLCRFYDVTSGEILINNVNIRKISLSNWYKFIGTLFQEFVRYHFSVKENITLGAPGKKDKKSIKKAAEKSGASDFIERLPNKYDQMLGREFEDGEELSTGEWQKLAIARAFYQQPPVLILDEPTSSIDAEAEYQIFNNLQSQYQDKSLIFVSHRFSTVRNANKIFVIDQGELIERGSHDKLMLLKGKYAHLFNIQAKGYK